MDFEKFTEKTRSLFQQSQTLAARRNNQSLEPEHLLKTMLDDEDAVTSKLLQSSGGDVNKIIGLVDVAVSKFPEVSGSGASGLRMSNDLMKIADNALKIAEKSGDKYVTVERLIQAMIMCRTSNISEILITSGVSDTNLNASINKMRQGRTADTANAEDQFDALNKYAKDLTKIAREGKLDPVIGRDEEIRRTVQVLSRRTKNNPVLIG